MANESLIATVNYPENFFKLKDLIGKILNNDGQDIANKLEGLITEGTLEYMGCFRFFARNIIDNSEIEVVCRPTTVAGTQMEVTNVNVWGIEVRSSAEEVTE